MTYDQEQELVGFRAFLATHSVSPENTRAVISVVTRLVKGHGLCLPNVKEASFLADEPIDPLRECDVDALKRQAEAWLPLKEDKGHGWKWNHPLNWIAKFQGKMAVQAKQSKGPHVRSKKTSSNDDDVTIIIAGLKRKRNQEAQEIRTLEERLDEKRVKLTRSDEQIKHLEATPGAAGTTEVVKATQALAVTA